MTRFIVFFATTTLLWGCATAAQITKNEPGGAQAGAIEKAPRSDDPAPTRANPGFYSRNDVERPVNLRARDIQACYEVQLKEHPRLSGRVEVSWTIGLDGRVTKISTKGLDEVGACIKAVIKSIQFRPPYGVPEVIKGYPLVFRHE